jgi:hypothetical protein
MDSENKQRGYDDSALLKRMADGLVSREFSSVDEAAKAVLGEDTGSNVDRLRRKFREQGWYERGLNDHVEAQILERGLIKPNMGARFCVRVEEAFRNPMPVIEFLAMVQLVLIIRDYDIDGRRITKLERLGGLMRVFSSVYIPLIAFEAIIYLVRLDSQNFGLEMLGLSGAMLALGFGMFWNRVSVVGDLAPYVEADRRWRKLHKDKKVERYRRYAEERAELKLRQQKIDLETA